jgi:hypothetical protein
MQEGYPSGCFKAIVEKLNAAASASFTPTLDQLDALLQSLQVTDL